MKIKHFLVGLSTLGLSLNVLTQPPSPSSNEKILSQPSELLTEQSSNTSALFQQQHLLQQRMIYKKVLELLRLSQSDSTLKVTQQLLDQIKDYALYPYATYQQLKARQGNLNLEEIAQYQKSYPDFTTQSQELFLLWLEQQQKNQQWENIVAQRAFLPNHIAVHCVNQQAEYELGKITGKNTALSHSDLQKLWLTSESLPKLCDPLLEIWRETGGLNTELIQQRALLAFEKGNSALLTHLEKRENDPALKVWLNDLLVLLKSPRALYNEKNIFSIDRLNSANEQHKRILLSVFPAFVKTLQEQEIHTATPFLPFEKWATDFHLTPQQTNQWKKQVIAQIFDSTHLEIQQWRDKELMQLKDDPLTERRIRLAIREKQPIEPWLNQLSSHAANKEEWCYWNGKLWQQKGKLKQAHEIWQSLLATGRGFYPILAAQELNVPYFPKMQTPMHPLNIAQQYPTQLARIHELEHHGDRINRKREWLTLLKQADFNQKLALAKYAEEQAWFDLQVESTIQAKAWDYISLRLPNAYQNWFDLWLKEETIDRTFAMAIARQESAWQPDVSSSANAHGLMQLLPSTATLTAKKFKLPYQYESQLFDPFDNIMLGTTHLLELYEQYGNNRILIAAAYNAGAKRVDSWLAKSKGQLSMAEFISAIPFYETRGYVQNVLTYDYYYQILQQKTVQKFTQQEYNRTY